MNIKVLYFARIKESVNYSSEELSLPTGVTTVRLLKQYLSTRGDVWAKIFTGKQVVRAAINHELVDDQAQIKAGDEVAFFPPVTGG
ncbi:MAG TPA: molybdopterin converting factor subunit 1 [Methylophilus sp.]|nr:molybdopterin converting factor subunit 1 [Methylophilus sp.]HQQ33506.1 molybdopterin converting factor subunit 1 [Methylophilus sp.]